MTNLFTHSMEQAPGRAIGVAVALLLLCLPALAQGTPILKPFESDTVVVEPNVLDAPIEAAWAQRNIAPAHLCSDEVYIRRVYLDVIGTIPDPKTVQAFLENASADKRAKLVDGLLKRDEFADYWAVKWCDILRVKAEFPINLWPNAVQAYHRWIRDSLDKNKHYDVFVRELLTSSGSNFRVPPVNFYRAIQGREPASIASAVALTFMGARFDAWPEEQRNNLAAFFQKVGYKKTGEWKEEIVLLDATKGDPIKATFPDGTTVEIAGDRDPRVVFANWLLEPGNPWLARNIVNRIWSWLFGRGIIHEPDDIRPDNPPAIPELLACLEKELVNAHYDLRHIYKLILTSRTYQRSSIPQTPGAEAEALFASYPVRRLDAEVLIDALSMICGGGEGYQSPIPEPFTFVPEYQRTITLADGSITSPFLELFGRPARDTGLESERNNQPTDAQRLHLLNSTHIQRKIMNSWKLQQLVASAKGDQQFIIETLYFAILSRYPTQAEVDVARNYLTAAKGAKQGAGDVAWALVNTKEFLYRH